MVEQEALTQEAPAQGAVPGAEYDLQAQFGGPDEPLYRLGNDRPEAKMAGSQRLPITA